MSKGHPKGYIPSENTRNKIAVRLLGNKNGSGHKMTDENKEKMRISKLGQNNPRFGKPSWNKGSKLSIEGRKKLSQAHIGKMTGAKNPSWKGGVCTVNKTERQIAMHTAEYKFWRLEVFERDDYTCQDCGIRGIELNADHIKPWSQYPELRYTRSNGRTLCVDCHRKTPTYGNRKE